VRFEGTDLTEVKPGLAESWEIEEQGGGSTLTFTLRDATFSSGNPVTAQDVVYSFDRVIQLESPSSFLLTDVAGLEVGSTVAVDDRTVQLILPEGVNPTIVLNLLTFNVGGIVDSETVQANEQGGDFGSTWLMDNSAGSGPFVLVRWDRNAQVALEANPTLPAPAPSTG
jgi:peptide/nickel transport system substrate-binding protein